MSWPPGAGKCQPTEQTLALMDQALAKARNAVIEECAKVARDMAVQMINELAKPWDTREIEDERLIYGHKIADLIEANIRALALSRPECK